MDVVIVQDGAVLHRVVIERAPEGLLSWGADNLAPGLIKEILSRPPDGGRIDLLFRDEIRKYHWWKE